MVSLSWLRKLGRRPLTFYKLVTEKLYHKRVCIVKLVTFKPY